MSVKDLELTCETVFSNKGGEYGLRRKEGRERRKEGQISTHRQAMADALEVIHLQTEGIWNR